MRCCSRNSGRRPRNEHMVETRTGDCSGLCIRDWRERSGLRATDASVDWGYCWRRGDGMFRTFYSFATDKGQPMIQLALLSALAISLLSFGSGAYITHRWYRVEALQSELRVMRLNARRFKAQLGLQKAIDASTREQEITDDEIVRAIEAKRPPPVVLRPTDPAPAVAVCVDDDSMRTIGTLGKRSKR